MNAERQALVTALLSKCGEAFRNSPADIASIDNKVINYTDPINQMKYVHMYFAKYVGCWRWVRKLLDYPVDGPVFSVGAGPCLCLFGWFFDRSPVLPQDIWALDLAPWREIRSLYEFQALAAHIGQGAPSFTFQALRYFPASIPPQGMYSAFYGASSIDPESLPQDATVILSMVLNHVIGINQPHPQPGMVFDWLHALINRVQRIIIVDMPYDRAQAFWVEVWQRFGLGFPPSNFMFSFNDWAAEFRSCFYMKADLRTGVTHPQFCVLSGLVHTRGLGWTWLHTIPGLTP